MDENFHNDEASKQLDLSLENKTLEDELHLKTGAKVHSFEEIDPEIHNQFLKNVLAFGEAQNEPEVPIKSLFPDDFKFPDEKTYSDEQVTQKLDEIFKILSAHHVEFGFANEIPDRVLYKHLVEKVIPEDTVSAPLTQAGFWVLDGCTGNCPDCFQKEFCETGKNYDNL
jgi:hypothetical protein